MPFNSTNKYALSIVRQDGPDHYWVVYIKELLRKFGNSVAEPCLRESTSKSMLKRRENLRRLTCDLVRMERECLDLLCCL